MCTEQSQLTMANGKKFSTGNHPVETLVPMLHLKQAGFDMDIYTPTGLPVKLEMWAMPKEDKHVMALYSEYQQQFRNPKSLAALALNDFTGDCTYVAIFFPGGHGALLGLPENKHVGALIKWAFNKDIYNFAICHGPAALLAAEPTDITEQFIYSGYKIAAFPDKVDKQTPMIGYMPGQLTWFFGKKLKSLGVDIVNSAADSTCHADRKLITGASPKAANALGKLCAEHLLASLGNK